MARCTSRSRSPTRDGYCRGPRGYRSAPYSGPVTPTPVDAVDDLRRNLAAVRAAIDSAAHRVGRDPAAVRLLPVSKTVSEARLRLAAASGITELAENKAQELARKAGALSDLPLRWTVIGHLQTNKAREVVEYAAEFQALDSLRIAAALDRRLQAAGRSLDVLVQVNTSGEENKSGIAPDEVAFLLRELPAYAGLRVRGLMTMAALTPDLGHVRECFTRLRELRDQLRGSTPDGIGLDELSMGMSGDFEIAVEEGATVVRIGRAIFGQRPRAGG